MIGYFKCHSKKTYIVNHRVCDEIIDCVDGSDEMFCQLTEVYIKNCQQINYIILECNENFQDAYEPYQGQLKENDKNIRFIKTDKSVNLSFIQNSIYLTILKIIDNREYFPKLQNVTLPNLYHVLIRNSSLTENSTIFKNQLLKLEYLDISINPINSISFLNNLQSNELKYLDISWTKIEILKKLNIKIIKNLKIFKLMNCKIIEIEINFFKNMFNLEILLMNKTEILNEIPNVHLKNLKNISNVKSDYFKICCLFWIQSKEKGKFNCSFSITLFQSCENLIDKNLKRLFYWSIGIFGCLGNFILIFFLLKKFQLKNLFNLQLHFCDLLISAYILGIAIIDNYYAGIYHSVDVDWRKGAFCQMTGTITTFAVILSSFSTFLITMERCLVIINPFKMSFISQQRIQYFVLSTFLAAIFSVIPFVLKNVRFYKQ